MGTDEEWEKWGQKDPYFAVLTDDKFRTKNLTDKTKREFFEFGKRQVDHICEGCRLHIDQDFFPKRVLEFGCGTARLVIPLAQIAEHVVGIDISESMLKEAAKNCEERSIKNVSLLKSDDNLSGLGGSFDFILSFYVFQHLPVERGRRIFKNLLGRLQEGGVCVVHFLYAKKIFESNFGFPPVQTSFAKLLRSTRRVVKAVFGIRPTDKDPEIQMNPYNVNELLFLAQRQGIKSAYMEFTEHRGEWGILLYFQKPRKA